jgi:hypothetical protein
MSDLADHRQVRLAQNQTLFRSVNERVDKVVQNFAADGRLGFVCECADRDCGSHIDLSHEEYDAVRQHPTHFLVLHDHVYPEVEVVVDERDRYVVVEMFGAGGRVATATDPRQKNRS